MSQTASWARPRVPEKLNSNRTKAQSSRRTTTTCQQLTLLVGNKNYSSWYVGAILAACAAAKLLPAKFSTRSHRVCDARLTKPRDRRRSLRPWLYLKANGIPFEEKQFLCATCPYKSIPP